MNEDLDSIVDTDNSSSGPDNNDVPPVQPAWFDVGWGLPIQVGAPAITIAEAQGLLEIQIGEPIYGGWVTNNPVALMDKPKTVIIDNHNTWDIDMGREITDDYVSIHMISCLLNLDDTNTPIPAYDTTNSIYFTRFHRTSVFWPVIHPRGREHQDIVWLFNMKLKPTYRDARRQAEESMLQIPSLWNPLIYTSIKGMVRPLHRHGHMLAPLNVDPFCSHHTIEDIKS